MWFPLSTVFFDFIHFFLIVLWKRNEDLSLSISSFPSSVSTNGRGNIKIKPWARRRKRLLGKGVIDGLDWSQIMKFLTDLRKMIKKTWKEWAWHLFSFSAITINFSSGTRDIDPRMRCLPESKVVNTSANTGEKPWMKACKNAEKIALSIYQLFHGVKEHKA